jgi:hypothetical protein
MAQGIYSIGVATGAIVATGGANAVIFTCRWTDTSRWCVIERLRVNAVVTGTITTAVPYDLGAYFVSAYTVAPTTSAASPTLTGRNQNRRTGGTATALEIYTLTTVAAGITGQTMTADSQPLALISGATGTVIGTQFFGGMATLLDSNDDHPPIILAANEGLSIQAPLAGPATGTFRVAINMDWHEIGVGSR